MASAGSIFVDLLLRDSQYQSGWQKVRNTTKQGSNQVQGDVKQIGTAFNSTINPVNNFGNAVKNLAGLFAGAFSVQKIIQYSDTWKQLSGRISIVQGEFGSLAKTQQDLFDIAQRTRQPLDGIMSFYSRLTQFIPEAERAQYDLLGTTEGVATALAITGETSASATAAMIQLTQAIGTNFESAGQELRSLQEQAPRLTQAIMRAIGDGTKSLQQLKEEGKLTRESFLNIFRDGTPEFEKLKEELAKVPLTVAQAFQRLDNAFLKFIGQSSEVSNGASSLALGISKLAENLDLVAKAVVALGVAMLSRGVASMITYSAEQIRIRTEIIKTASAAATQAAAFDKLSASMVTNSRLTAALAKQQAAAAGTVGASTIIVNRAGDAGVVAAGKISLASRAIGGLTLAGKGLLDLFGGTLGASITALAGAVYYLSTYKGQATEITEKYAEQLERVRERAATLTVEVDGVSVSIEDMSNTIERSKALKNLESELDDVNKSAQLLKITLSGFAVDTGNVFSDFVNSVKNDFDILNLAFTDRETFGALREIQEEFKNTGDVDAYAEALQRLGEKSEPVNKIYESIANQIEALKVAKEAANDLEDAIYNATGEGVPKPGRKPRVPDSFSDTQGNSSGGDTGKTGKSINELDALLKQHRALIMGIDSQTLRYIETEKELEKLFKAQRISVDEYYTALETLDKQYEKTAEKAQKFGLDIDEFGKQAARNLQDAFSDFLFDPFEKGLDGMLASFGNTLRRMAAEAAAQSILTNLFSKDALGGVGGIFGEIFGSIGEGLAGARATGGHVQAGSSYLVGERGMEVFTPTVSGTIIPNNALSGGGGVVVNIINNTPSQVSTRQGSNGTSIEVLIDQAVATNMARAGSQTNQSLRNQASQGLVRR